MGRGVFAGAARFADDADILDLDVEGEDFADLFQDDDIYTLVRSRTRSYPRW